MRVVEYTGGSTGSSLALVCAIKGYRFVPVSSDGFAKEKLQTMRIFGADLRIISSENGQLTPELFRTMIVTRSQRRITPISSIIQTQFVGTWKSETSSSIKPVRKLRRSAVGSARRGCWLGVRGGWKGAGAGPELW